MSALVSLGAALLAAGTTAAEPAITAVEPDPISLGAMAQVLGSGFEPEATTIRVAEQPQDVIFVQEDGAKVVFQVASETPLGPADLVLTTSQGEATWPVEVAPPAPKILTVAPSPLLLGSLGTVNGSGLSSISDMTLDGIACETTSVADHQIVFIVPFVATLVGDAELIVSGNSGLDVAEVSVAAPPPAIDQITPNPARQGDLVTIRGAIIPLNARVEIGGHEAPIISAMDGELVAQVPPAVATGPRQVVMYNGPEASEPAGPLHVNPADPERPTVEGVYPASVMLGAAFWATGAYLGGVDTISHGVTMDECNPRACRFGTAAVEAEPGPIKLALSGPAGSDVLSLTVLPAVDGYVAPSLAAAEPQPAFRGEALTLRGNSLHQVNAVVVGGVVQPIDFVAPDSVVVTLREETPMGAEPAFVSGTGGSNAIAVTVLEPFGGPEPDATEPMADAGAEPSPDAGAEAETHTEPDAIGGDGAGSDASPEVTADSAGTGGSGGSTGGGCASSAPAPRAGALALALLLLAAIRRRYRR